MKISRFTSQILNVPEDEPLTGALEKEGAVRPIVILTLATDDGTTPGVRQSYQLTSEGDGCRVNYQLALDGVPKVFEPLVRAQLHHQVPRMLRRLGEMAAATAARS